MYWYLYCHSFHVLYTLFNIVFFVFFFCSLTAFMLTDNVSNFLYSCIIIISSSNTPNSRSTHQVHTEKIKKILLSEMCLQRMTRTLSHTQYLYYWWIIHCRDIFNYIWYTPLTAFEFTGFVFRAIRRMLISFTGNSL